MRTLCSVIQSTSAVNLVSSVPVNYEIRLLWLIPSNVHVFLWQWMLANLYTIWHALLHLDATTVSWLSPPSNRACHWNSSPFFPQNLMHLLSFHWGGFHCAPTPYPHHGIGRFAMEEKQWHLHFLPCVALTLTPTFLLSISRASTFPPFSLLAGLLSCILHDNKLKVMSTLSA